MRVLHPLLSHKTRSADVIQLAGWGVLNLTVTTDRNFDGCCMLLFIHSYNAMLNIFSHRIQLTLKAFGDDNACRSQLQ
jgi:hypothetical protein